MATTTKKEQRQVRHRRVRAKISGSAECPRLAVFKSNRYISAQLINDDAGVTLASVHGKSIGGALSKQSLAVGAEIAKKAQALGIKKAVFDRGGYLYEGQVKAIAESAREAGLTI